MFIDQRARGEDDGWWLADGGEKTMTKNERCAGFIFCFCHFLPTLAVVTRVSEWVFMQMICALFCGSRVEVWIRDADLNQFESWMERRLARKESQNLRDNYKLNLSWKLSDKGRDGFNGFNVNRRNEDFFSVWNIDICIILWNVWRFRIENFSF